ncbi:hypothetical protein [Paenibacillus thalictri]|uniref:SMI1/KNR4 family protein n=1 Tax=Paenibacillus thalictri TaxID=2527873 RepID=A0A4Q9DTS1_9BACL|nr:hypothetical protein [Paenibacillus thalictri]TBL77888.1 hypothetical protein EYB31_17300 [Paenibacillus thalictri]
MDNSRFYEAIKKITIEYKHETISNKTNEFFIRHELPKELVQFFETHSYDRTIKFRHNSFYRINDIPEENSDFPNEKCIQNNLLIIGYGLNGDYIVLNLNTQTIGYIFHDDLYENEEIDIKDIYINMDCSLGDFFYNSINTEDFPVDGFQAEKYINKD